MNKTRWALTNLACHLVLLTPLSFIPGLALVVMSAIRCLTLARLLHKPVSSLISSLCALLTLTDVPFCSTSPRKR